MRSVIVVNACIRCWIVATVLALALPAAARAQDPAAPPGSLPHYLPPERWVYQHWLPYDEAQLYRVLGKTRAQIWHHLRDDRKHNLGQLARKRGLTPRRAAERLVAPRRGSVSRSTYARLVRRAERTLTQGHMSQHLLFHSLHQLAIPDRARWIFGTRSVEEYLRLRRGELSPQQIGRLHGRTQKQMLDRSNAALRTEARKGVRNRSMTSRQAAILLDRQLRQVPRFLGQSRYNGPPQTGPGSKPILPPNDYANNPSITADGSAVVFDAYRATIPEAVKLGEIHVQRFDVASAARQEVSHTGEEPTPLSAYNSQVSADGSAVVFEQAAGNLNFAKRYGAMKVLLRSGTDDAIEISHLGVKGSRTAYNPSVSADGTRVVYETSDDRGARKRSANGLELFDASTGKRRRLGGGSGYGAVYEPRISGDGRSVAFTVADGESLVYLRRIATGDTTLVARGGREPAVSHAGTVVAYTTGSGGRSVLAVRDTTVPRTLRLDRGPAAGGKATEPSISPDGRFVAFAVRRGENSQIVLGDTTTGTVIAVSDRVRGAATEPVVSADGRRVAYTTTAALPGKPLGTAGVVLADLAAGTSTLLSTHDPIKAGPGAKERAAPDRSGAGGAPSSRSVAGGARSSRSGAGRATSGRATSARTRAGRTAASETGHPSASYVCDLAV